LAFTNVCDWIGREDKNAEPSTSRAFRQLGKIKNEFPKLPQSPNVFEKRTPVQPLEEKLRQRLAPVKLRASIASPAGGSS
jgi:hypothetical protein